MSHKYHYPLYESPKNYRDIHEALEDIEKLFPQRPAVSYRIKPNDKEAVRIGYPQLVADVRALGTEMLSRGMSGKHVALVASLSYEWIVFYLASLSIGAVLVPLDKDWTAPDLTDTILRAECSFLFCEGNLADKAEEIRQGTGLPTVTFIGKCAEDVDSVAKMIEAGRAAREAGNTAYDTVVTDPGALALLVFTSGTTGKGKGVMLSQENLISDLHWGLKLITFQGKTLGVLPPHHTYGSTVGILALVLLGIELYVSAGLKYISNELKQEKPGVLVVVPLYLETFYRRIMSSVKDKGKEKSLRRGIKISNFLRHFGIDLRKKLFGEVLSAFGGNITMAVSGGAPLNREMADTFDALGITVCNGYGITECAPLIAVNRPKFNDPASVGFPLPCDTIRIEDPNEDGEGEICVKGPNVMLGYWKDEEATNAAIDPEGFFHTGDYGRVDKHGRIYITGRKKNLIILSNGKNVYPEEIETALNAVPGITDIVVYEGQSRRGMEHNAIVAEIFPDADFMEKNGITDAEAYFRPFVDDYNRTAVPYKKIGLLRVRTEPFPKNTLRKIMRFKMDMTID